MDDKNKTGDTTENPTGICSVCGRGICGVSEKQTKYALASHEKACKRKRKIIDQKIIKINKLLLNKKKEKISKDKK